MRVLTFMQISDGKSEISFETIVQELQLESDQVEAFIIDGLFSNMYKLYQIREECWQHVYVSI